MFQKINISIADKISASQTSSDINDPTSSAPTTVNGSPGDSNVAKPDVSGINSAGPDIAQKQTDAQSKTGPQERSAAIPSEQKYENPQDAEFPKEQDPGKVAPTPKKKGFMESLIEAKATEYMQSKMQTPEADNGAKGKDVPEPNIAKAPDNKSSERPRPQTWKPNTNGSKDPGMPNQDLMDGTIDKRSQNPNYNSNKPTYKGIQYNAPKINFPKIKGL